jgi:hypothetical protein
LWWKNQKRTTIDGIIVDTTDDPAQTIISVHLMRKGPHGDEIECHHHPPLMREK